MLKIRRRVYGYTFSGFQNTNTYKLVLDVRYFSLFIFNTIIIIIASDMVF